LRTRPLAIRFQAENLKRIQVELPINIYVEINLTNGLQECKMDFLEMDGSSRKPVPHHLLKVTKRYQRDWANALLGEAAVRGKETMTRRLLQDLFRLFRPTRYRPTYIPELWPGSRHDT
jgi:hypothetical protein